MDASRVFRSDSPFIVDPVLPGLSERDQSEVAALTPTQWQKRRQAERQNPSG